MEVDQSWSTMLVNQNKQSPGKREGFHGRNPRAPGISGTPDVEGERPRDPIGHEWPEGI